MQSLRDQSLITGRGGYKMGKSRVRNFLRPPPPPLKTGLNFSRPPTLLKSGNFSRPPPPAYNMAKTSSYCVKTTSKLFMPAPSASLKLPPPPLFVGVKLHVHPLSRFVAPHPLPVLSDQSLRPTFTSVPSVGINSS